MIEQQYRLGYKVLAPSRMSVIDTFNDYLTPYALKYPILVRVIPEDYCGPLAVFNCKDATYHFKLTNGRALYHTVRCVYMPDTSNVCELWTPDARSHYMPEGTRLASEVICLE